MGEHPTFDVFLSHNSADKLAVEIIAHRLRAEAGLNPFLDKWHLIPGVPWQEALENALDHSVTVAIFIGSSGISPWHNEELRKALDQAVRTRDEYRIIPILLPGANNKALSGFLARRTWVDFRSGLDDTEAFERLVAGIKGEAIHSGTYELPDDPAPYRGLHRFEAEQSVFFFGREADLQRLVEKLSQYPFVAVIGASGSGKSSLVRAGLLPSLADDTLRSSRTWHTLICTPGGQPLRALAEQLATLVPPTDRLRIADELAERFATRIDGLHTAVSTLLANHPQPRLLVIDQFEEIFTLCQDGPERCRAQTQQFIANLTELVQHGEGSIRLVITLRADFLDRCLAFPQLKDLLQDRQILLGPLNEPALRDAIVRPAQLVGAFFEKGLVSTILRDVQAQPGVLPLLQHALFELWRARRGPWLTLEAYEAIGGVSGALQRRAQLTYEALTPDQQELARNIFLRLTTLGQGVSDTRRRVSRVELYLAGIAPAQVDTVLQALSGPQARLIVANEQTVEVAHEALIQQWSTLRQWLEAGREALRVHRHLTQTAQEWNELGCDPGGLYRGARLAQAVEWAEAHADDMNPLEREFLEASRALQVSELEAARKRAAQLRNRALYLTGALLIATCLALAAVWFERQARTSEEQAIAQRDEARRQQQIALSKQLAAQAQLIINQRSGPLARALLLATEAMRRYPSLEPDQAIRSGLDLLPGTIAYLPHEGYVTGLAFR